MDIEEFLELRKNTGDDRRRTHDMNTANWVPDLFMKRVQNDEEWALFSPGETPELHDLIGKEFEETYDEYVAEVKSFDHSWEFASWNPSYREKDSENLGKTFLLGQQWDGVKSLDKKSIGYKIGKAYFAAKRNTSIKG